MSSLSMSNDARANSLGPTSRLSVPDLWILAFLGLLGSALFLLTRLYPVYDDAYITFRYAENLANGLGFTFNPGDPPVQGTTTPLFTLLLALVSYLGLAVPKSAAIIGAVCHGVTVIVLGRLIALLLDRRAGLFVAALYAISFPAMNISGMETPLYTLTIALSFYFMATQRWNLALFLAGTATLVRIDGALVAVVVVGVHLLQTRRIPVLPLVIYTLTVLPWFIFAYLTFGSLLPNSFLAKMAFEPNVSGRFSPLGYFNQFGYIFGLDPFVFVAPFVVLGMIGAWRKATVRPLVIWFVAYLTAYTFALLPPHTWYFTPTFALVYLFLYIGVQDIVTALRIAFRHDRVQAIQRLTVWAFVLLFAVNLLQDTLLMVWKDPFGRTALQEDAHYQAGMWLAQNAQSDEVVAAKEIGLVGYYSEMRIIDILGLVSPDVVPLVRDRQYAQVVKTFQPDYVFVDDAPWDVVSRPILESSAFKAQYIPAFSQVLDELAQIHYTLYQRLQ